MDPKRRSGRWVATVLALVTLAAVAPVAAAVASPSAIAAATRIAAPHGIAGPNAPLASTDALGIFRSGARGIALLSESGFPDARVRLALQDLVAGRRYHLVGVTTRCRDGDAASDPVFRYGFVAAGGGSVFVDTAVSDLFVRSVAAIRSLRLYQGRGTSDEVACAVARTYAAGTTPPAPPRPPYDPRNVLISEYRAPRLTGLVVTRITDANDIRYTASIFPLVADRRYKLVGSALGCSRPHTAADWIFTSYFVGTRTFIDYRNVPTGRPIGEIRSLRIFEAAPGWREVDCSPIVAVLIG